MNKALNSRTLGYAAHVTVKPIPPLEPVTLAQLQRMSEQHEKIKPLFNRQDLEILASGKISSVFGPLFAQQDAYVRQVRMPMPPVLFVDRVMKIEGEPGSMSKGKIWTETDIAADAWYLHDGHMPPGIMVEAGQANLLLVSWMGADFYNKGERIFRLLGANTTFHGELPKPGDTLCFEIELEGFAKLGDLRLAFFHYDGYINGELRISMRKGQAGFFTDKELAESAGIVWDAATAKYKANARVDAPKVICQREHFNAEQVKAFAAGDIYQCFGAGFEKAQTQKYSPRIEKGALCFIDEVTHFNPTGGPAGRGYMRAIQKISPDAWFFKGHFKNDPCMPGSLMAQAGSQLLNFYLAALGYTLDKEGWRFEPVSGEELQMRCRGQCLPTNKEISYEIFIEEVISEPYPTVYAHLLGMIDGLKALYVKGACMRLVPKEN
ncbi:MAG TPA: hypothetical protein VHE99_08880 [Gammaproteobacteria bacterium]|nr:hypothetical protein [Gammaproteobacteria bacterium]